MSDEPGFIHIARSEFTPQEHDPECVNPNAELKVGYGLAAGGFGAYGICPNCWAILWKTQDDG